MKPLWQNLFSLKPKSALGVSCQLETNLLNKISSLADEMGVRLENLETAIKGSKEPMDTAQKGEYYRKVIVSAMQSLREVVDELETLVDSQYWSLPTYSELLFSVI